jgi:hypothetical protein
VTPADSSAIGRLVRDPGAQRVQQVLLGREEVKEGPLREPRPGDDRLHGEAGRSLLDEELPGGLEQRSPAVRILALPSCHRVSLLYSRYRPLVYW